MVYPQVYPQAVAASEKCSHHPQTKEPYYSFFQRYLLQPMQINFLPGNDLA